MADDVVDKIEHDHREVEDLFAEFRRSKDRAVALQICDELEAHTAAEESEVYPVVAAAIDEELADHAQDEHDDAAQLIEQVRATTDADALDALMSELERSIAHHVEEEESEMLPLAREQLTDGQLEDLADKFEDAKQEASSEHASGEPASS